MCSNLDGATNQPQVTIQRLSQIANHSQSYVLVDEGENSIEDAHFYVRLYPDTRWQNLPTDRHSQGGTFSFADGHAESWQWRYHKQRARDVSWHLADDPGDLADLRRVQQALPISSTNVLSMP
jgi:prepilin-type processing-associated H-X9-DG protein